MEYSLLYIGLGLLGASLLLLMIEAFVPSGGLIGAVSAICGVTGLVLLFNHSVPWGISGLLSMLVLGPVGFFWAFNTMTQTPFGQSLVGARSEAQLEQRALDERARLEARQVLVGAQGETVTVCRPVGEAEIDGERYEVHAEGALLPVGTRVRVVSASLEKIRVRSIS
ncbi:MAG: membrane-bound ClpP family serine protease [Phycisphaerales bacterium]|jgi:membrane-bound ClpP family serine protease